VYAQDEYRITDEFRVNLGLRLDHHHRLKSLQLNPRIGLIWDITPSLTTKFVYGSAFRAPNAFEQDLVIQNVNSANSNNREEKIKSYEATVEWRPEQHVKLMGTFFHNYLTQILEQNPNNQQFQNLGSFKSFGFELQGEKRWDNGRLLKLSWTHQYARESSAFGSHWAVDSPKNLVKFHYAEPLFDDHLRIGFEEIFVDERLTLRSNRAPGYHLFNINLALAKPFYGFQASLGIYNVLDQRYKVIGGSEHNQDTLATDGRTVRFRLDYGFQ
jgi:iron complex outermembrane receptor protein